MSGISLGIQTVAFLIAMVEIILALYVLLEWRRRANAQFAVSLVILAVNTYALGRLGSVSGEDASFLPVLLLALTGPLIVPSILFAFLAMIGPARPRPGWIRWANPTVLGIAALPVLLTAIDLIRLQAHLSGSALWFTPLGPRYPGGFVDKTVYTSGTYSGLVNLLVYGGLGVPLLLLAITILIRRESLPTLRHFAALTLLSQAFGIFPNIVPLQPEAAWIFILLANNACFITIAVATFRNRTPEEIEELQNYVGFGQGGMPLQSRLTLLALIITLPLLASMGILLTDQGRSALEKNALASLAATNRNIVDASEIWLANNTRTLRMLAANPEIQSMEPDRQLPALRDLVSIYPDIFLVEVVDLDGKNTARSDDKPGGNYSQMQWFQQAKRGVPISFVVQPAEDGGTPTLTAAAPIRDPNGQVLGAVMFTSQLTQVQRLVNAQTISATGASVMIIDENNRLVASTDPEAKLMVGLGHLGTVQTLRSSKLGAYRYVDSRGDYWNSNLNVLSNDWGVIVLQPERTLFAPISNFQRVSAAVLALGAIILMLLTWSSIRQSMAPVRSLTDMAKAIAAGDLSQTAPIFDRNELGILAQAFNNMTAQLRESFTTLETRVSERTRDLERRAVQLQVTAEVAREAAGIHNPDQLLQDATRLISERFGHYHAGIFLIEGSIGRGEAEAGFGEYAVLRAASSEDGRRMLKRGHRLAVARRPGEGQGIVGFVAGTGQPRIALDVGKESVYFNNPDLPLTRSEMAVPLKIQNRVVGVIDVQSRKQAAFDDQDVTILQVLADQLAVALQNAELLAESQQALDELENLYGVQIQQGWRKRLGDQPLAYQLADGKVGPIESSEETAPPGAINENSGDARIIEAPIVMRSAQFGTLRIRRAENQEAWSVHDRELVEQTLARLAQALENARLVEEIQKRARQEELINQMVARTQSTLNLDSVMRTAVEEIVRAVNVSRVQLRLHITKEANGNGGSHPSATPAQAENSSESGGEL